MVLVAGRSVLQSDIPLSDGAIGLGAIDDASFLVELQQKL